MVKKLCVAALLAVSATAAQAVTVDGILDAEYRKTASVFAAVGAPIGNFGSPGTTNAVAYDIYLASDGTNLYGFFQAATPVTADMSFANLYFDLDPGNGAGSDIVVEVKNQRWGIAGSTPPLFPATIPFFSGTTAFEFSIAHSLLDNPNPAASNEVYLRMSQSFGYSVAGGDAYGADGLGGFTLYESGVLGAIPEPATWGMMLAGFGLVGSALRRRARTTAFA